MIFYWYNSCGKSNRKKLFESIRKIHTSNPDLNGSRVYKRLKQEIPNSNLPSKRTVRRIWCDIEMDCDDLKLIQKQKAMDELSENLEVKKLQELDSDKDKNDLKDTVNGPSLVELNPKDSYADLDSQDCESFHFNSSTDFNDQENESALLQLNPVNSSASKLKLKLKLSAEPTHQVLTRSSSIDYWVYKDMYYYYFPANHC